MTSDPVSRFERIVARPMTARRDWDGPSWRDAPPEMHHIVPPDVLRRACLAWMSRREPVASSDLGYEIDGLMGHAWQTAWPFGRMADRLVQKLRTAGLIECRASRRGWWLTEDGRRVMLEVPHESPRRGEEE